jgi:cytochrome P450
MLNLYFLFDNLLENRKSNMEAAYSCKKTNFYQNNQNELESNLWNVGSCLFAVSNSNNREKAQEISIFASDLLRVSEKNSGGYDPYPICPAILNNNLVHLVSDSELQKKFLKFHRYGFKPASSSENFFQKITYQFTYLFGLQSTPTEDTSSAIINFFKDGDLRNRILKVFSKPNFLTLYEGENEKIRSTTINFFNQNFLKDFEERCSFITQSWIEQVGKQGKIQLFRSVSELVSRFLIEGILGYTCYSSEEMNLQTYIWKELFSPLPSEVQSKTPQKISDEILNLFSDVSAVSVKAEIFYSQLTKMHEFAARIIEFGCSEEGQKRKNLPNYLFQEGIDPQLIEGTIQIMLLAGQETTSHLLAFILYEYAANPQLIENLPSLTPENFKSSFLEGLRKYPTGGATREAGVDIEVENKQTAERYYIQKGEPISCCPYIAGHDATLWQNPEEYNPSRANLSHVKQKVLPFGHGAHRCVGEKAVEVEVTTALSEIFKHLKLATNEKLPELVDFVVLKPVRDIEVTVEFKKQMF